MISSIHQFMNSYIAVLGFQQSKNFQETDAIMPAQKTGVRQLYIRMARLLDEPTYSPPMSPTPLLEEYVPVMGSKGVGSRSRQDLHNFSCAGD